MTWSRLLLVPLVMAALTPSAPAGIFSRKPKPNPADRVPELLIQLKTSQDEGQRTAAADELRQYDPKAYPDIVTGLMDALGRDASPVVRSEAATSLGRLRPISQQAGYALEQAQNNDAVVRVRLAARQALWQYHLVGYRGDKPADAPTGPSTAKVLAAGGPATPAPPRTIGQTTSRSFPAGAGRESAEPPLAVPPTAPISLPQSSGPVQLIPVNPGLKPAPNAPKSPAQSGNVNGPALPPPG